MTLAALADAPLSAVTADALVVTVSKEGLGAAASEVDAQLQGLLSTMHAGGEIRGRFGEVTIIPGGGALAARRLAVVGLGSAADLDCYRLHNAYTFAGRELRRRRLTRAALAVDVALGDRAGSVENLLRCMVTGLLVANHTAGSAKHRDDDVLPTLDEVLVAGVGAGTILETVLAEAVLLAESTERVQGWASAPANELTPSQLAATVTEMCAGTSLAVELIEREELERLGAGALLGIARGSAEQPVMITVRHDGGDPQGPVLGLVGKGITFDTGGISIKPALGMEMMKFDLGGGAAVLAAIHAIAALGLPCNVLAVVPATENMPGSRALKPGDVVRALDGTSIEVVNTDAEGRVVLADGLLLARRMGATHLVDVATLTGAAVVALGHVSAALMGSDEHLLGLLEAAARPAGDRFCRLPLHPEYACCLHSDVADLRNWGNREAGSISAAVFLKEFTGGLPWAHLDIAGTAWNSQGNLREVPDGPTGSPVRTLVWLARLFAREGVPSPASAPPG